MKDIDLNLKTSNYQKYQEALSFNLLKFNNQIELNYIINDINKDNLIIKLDQFNYNEYLTDIFKINFYNTIDFIKINNDKLDEKLIENLKLTLNFISNTINHIFWNNINKLYDAKNNLINVRKYNLEISNYLSDLYFQFKEIVANQLLNIISHLIDSYLKVSYLNNNDIKLNILNNNLTSILDLISEKFLSITKLKLQYIYKVFGLKDISNQTKTDYKKNFDDFLNDDYLFETSFSDELKALEFLGLENNVTWNEIKTKYKQLAIKYHPDNNLNNNQAQEMMKKINSAYNLLKKHRK
ncbi:DnaJ domain-containing protein [Mycoplasma cottewii]|uniref:DnaJ domain-containing protein n=1 Tax=Mycoplasma cottewii TaxID=51364 RepID=A0ABY5TZD8_9MOLU|nr:DnaJ domain-containing protein [Mycoplasma cottewii]UWD35386.1 DnaJ domain-containing protein [Mycoplasma cottewii]